MTGITIEQMQHILKTAHRILPDFLKENSEALEDRTGGHMVVQSEDGTKMLENLIGTLPHAKNPKQKQTFAHEKISRLSERRAAGHPDRTSFPTQNYSKHQYGGAIWIALGLYISFSAFPPRYDTLFVVTVLWECGYVGREEADDIMAEMDLYEFTGVE